MWLTVHSVLVCFLLGAYDPNAIQCCVRRCPLFRRQASVKYVSYEQVDGYPGHFRKKANDDDDDDVASQTQLSIQQV